MREMEGSLFLVVVFLVVCGGVGGVRTGRALEAVPKVPSAAARTVVAPPLRDGRQLLRATFDTSAEGLREIARGAHRYAARVSSSSSSASTIRAERASLVLLQLQAALGVRQRIRGKSELTFTPSTIHDLFQKQDSSELAWAADDASTGSGAGAGAGMDGVSNSISGSGSGLPRLQALRADPAPFNPHTAFWKRPPEERGTPKPDDPVEKKREVPPEQQEDQYGDKPIDKVKDPDSVGGYILPDTYMWRGVPAVKRPGYYFPFNMFNGPGPSDYFMDHWGNPGADPSVTHPAPADKYVPYARLRQSSGRGDMSE